MKKNYDWDAIRVRYARGETAYAISKSMDGRPTRQGIRKRAEREDWLRIDPEIPECVRNLELLKIDSEHPRKRTPETVNAILEFIQRGATEEMAARAAGISPRTHRQWKSGDPDFARLIEVARARKLVEWVEKIDQAKDWKAQHKLLQVAPETREQFADRRKDESPTIILNIHRDEVVIEQVAQRTEVTQPVLETIDFQEPVEELQTTAEPVEKSVNWQGVTLEEKTKVGHEALEQRVMNSKKQKA